jgi:hypothetical protein
MDGALFPGSRVAFTGTWGPSDGHCKPLGSQASLGVSGAELAHADATADQSGNWRPSAVPIGGNGVDPAGVAEGNGRSDTRGEVCPKNALVVENDIEKRTMHMQSAIPAQPAFVIDEPQLAELIHKETDARTDSADHLGPRFLPDLRNDGPRLALH